MHSDGGEFSGASLAHVEAIDLKVGYTIDKRYRIDEYDPLSAHAEIAQKTQMSRRGWSVAIESRARLSADREHFRLQAELDAYEDGARVFSRSWDRKIRRDGV